MSKTTLIDSRIRKYAYREISQIYQDIGASPDGLSHEQVEAMREKYGANSFTERKNDTMIRRLRRAFINPFNIILFILGIISLVTDVFLVSNFARNATTAIIIFSMILISGAIRLIQELRAKNAAQQLNRLIHESITVRREGELIEISAEKLVVGDIVLLSAGDRVPADIRLTEVTDLFISQAAITGESAILEKSCRALSYSSLETLTQLENLAFMATTVISGKGEGIVLAVGKDTLYGSFAKPDSDDKKSFQKGANSIAWVMLRFIAVLIPIVFALLGVTGGKWLESFAFALSVAVGLMPEMLPMVITACLARGSLTMSRKQTIIKDINAMQGFGSMDSEKRRRFVYVRIYSGTLHLRDVIKISEKEKIKITEMCVPTNGELYSSDTACSGDIVILPNDVLQLNSILGNEMLLPQRKFIENPLPMLQTTIAVKKSEQREILLGALTEISDGDPLLKYYVDTTTHEIILSFLGNVQMEVICAILEEKYHVEAEIKEPTVIYMERPLRKAEYTIHIEVPPNPFWASVGLSIEPLPIGSGVQYESRVSLGYLNQSFQNAVMEGVLYGCEQGLYGWKVTDCKICFEYGLYYSPVSTPADFRLLSPIVLEQALKKAGTELLEPYLHFEIYAPQEYLSRAYHDAPRYCADIVSTQIKNDEVILKGEIPARCIQEYRNDLTYFTNGQGVCLTELKGYQPAIGKFICQPRRPNSRIDKVRHMFHKLA